MIITVAVIWFVNNWKLTVEAMIKRTKGIFDWASKSKKLCKNSQSRAILYLDFKIGGQAMEYATVEIKVPKAMQTYFSDDYVIESGEELKRNALLLYPYIHKNVISHGRAAEILGIKKLDLIDLYDEMGFPYFDMDINDVMQDMQNFRDVRKALA